MLFVFSILRLRHLGFILFYDLHALCIFSQQGYLLSAALLEEALIYRLKVVIPHLVSLVLGWLPWSARILIELLASPSGAAERSFQLAQKIVVLVLLLLHICYRLVEFGLDKHLEDILVLWHLVVGAGFPAPMFDPPSELSVNLGELLAVVLALGWIIADPEVQVYHLALAKVVENEPQIAQRKQIFQLLSMIIDTVFRVDLRLVFVIFF